MERKDFLISLEVFEFLKNNPNIRVKERYELAKVKFDLKNPKKPNDYIKCNTYEKWENEFRTSYNIDNNKGSGVLDFSKANINLNNEQNEAKTDVLTPPLETLPEKEKEIIPEPKEEPEILPALKEEIPAPEKETPELKEEKKEIEVLDIDNNFKIGKDSTNCRIDNEINKRMVQYCKDNNVKFYAFLNTLLRNILEGKKKLIISDRDLPESKIKRIINETLEEKGLNQEIINKILDNLK